MDVTSVCCPLRAGSDSQNNTTSAPNAASVTDADKVIKTKIASTQVEGAKSDEAYLKGLLADDYCHVCDAVLLFESQRLSHYEGKKHAQKLKVYLQAKRAERTNTQSTGPQWTMTTHKDRFCDLCKMVFSSQVVAKSHYEGKIHTKNLRKQGLQPPVADRNTEVCSLAPDPDEAELKHAPQGGMGHHVDPAASSTALSTEADLMDPNKYCALCAASFNNPHMALQHYSGRKHQRNQARQELMKELGDDAQQDSFLMCQMCSMQFSSVEMYQAHMQGNKHQVREKKVVDLCKSQQRAYSTFADELADYIQVQKARGITPKANQVSLQGDKADEEDEEDEQKFDTGDVTKLHKPLPSPPSKFQPHYPSRPASYVPVEAWNSQYQGPSWPSHQSATNFPPSVLLESGSTQFPGRTMTRKRQRKQSSSSSYTSSSSYSSYSSSYSSSTSETDDSEYRRRGRRTIRRPRKDRSRRTRDEAQRRKDRNERDETRRDDYGESGHEARRKKLKHHSKRGEEEKSWEEDCEVERRETVMDSLKPKEVNDGKQTEEHIRTEMHVEQDNDGRNESARNKSRKDKKKMKVVKADTRTEEEKLWDDSILGC